jgi:hypothetical protein
MWPTFTNQLMGTAQISIICSNQKWLSLCCCCCSAQNDTGDTEETTDEVGALAAGFFFADSGVSNCVPAALAGELPPAATSTDVEAVCMLNMD